MASWFGGKICSHIKCISFKEVKQWNVSNLYALLHRKHQNARMCTELFRTNSAGIWIHYLDRFRSFGRSTAFLNSRTLIDIISLQHNPKMKSPQPLTCLSQKVIKQWNVKRLKKNFTSKYAATLLDALTKLLLLYIFKIRVKFLLIGKTNLCDRSAPTWWIWCITTPWTDSPF